jgi:type III restriction enzyme
MLDNGPGELPDILSHLQKETKLTKASLSRILIESTRLADFLVNSQSFIENVVSAIRNVLLELTVSGIHYELIAGRAYKLALFENHEIQDYVSRMVKCKNSIYEYIGFDSETEKRFAEELNGREDIKLFLKLPNWFQISTPLGQYNPDWAIVKGEEKKLYLVRETKASVEEEALRGDEVRKVKCGKAHFDALGVDFRVVTSASEV